MDFCHGLSVDFGGVSLLGACEDHNVTGQCLDSMAVNIPALALQRLA